MPDTRRYQRLRLGGHVAVKTPMFGERLRVMRACLDDISLGGARLYAEEEVGVDQPVNMRVRIPWSGRTVQGMGRVRHVTLTKRLGRPRYALGIEFLTMNRDKVRRMIEDKLNGGRRRFAPHRQRKREATLVLRLAPVLVLMTWLIVNAALRAQSSIRAEEQFTRDFRKGVLHFLYNSK